MLKQQVEAIFENGVLKPLTPLDLVEHERVSLLIGANGENANDDNDSTDYAPFIAEEGDPSIAWEQVQALLTKLPGSLSEDFDRERDERF